MTDPKAIAAAMEILDGLARHSSQAMDALYLLRARIRELEGDRDHFAHALIQTQDIIKRSSAAPTKAGEG